MSGWIATYRKLQDWEWYTDSYMVHLFIHLLLSANHKPKKWRGIDIKRGQFITGRKALSVATGISEQTVRTCLKRLKSTSEITIESTNGFSLVTVCKYDEYQSSENTINQPINQPANQQLTSDQPATNHKQQCNNITKEQKREKTTLPEFISKDIFKSFLDHRKKIKAPMTDQAVNLLISKLEKEHNKGFDCNQALEEALLNGWKSIFPKVKRKEEQPEKVYRRLT